MILDTCNNKSAVAIELTKLESFAFDRGATESSSEQPLVFKKSDHCNQDFSSFTEGEKSTRNLLFNMKANVLVKNPKRKHGIITEVNIKLLNNENILDSITYNFPASNAIVAPNSYEYKQIATIIKYPVPKDLIKDIICLNDDLAKQIEKTKLEFTFEVRQNNNHIETKTELIDVSDVSLY